MASFTVQKDRVKHCLCAQSLPEGRILCVCASGRVRVPRLVLIDVHATGVGLVQAHSVCPTVMCSLVYLNYIYYTKT